MTENVNQHIVIGYFFGLINHQIILDKVLIRKIILINKNNIQIHIDLLNVYNMILLIVSRCQIIDLLLGSL